MRVPGYGAVWDTGRPTIWTALLWEEVHEVLGLGEIVQGVQETLT